MLNSYQGREESINFWTEVEPLFSTLPNNIVMMAGDLGAGNWAQSLSPNRARLCTSPAERFPSPSWKSECRSQSKSPHLFER